MTPHKQHLERTMVNYFCGLNTDERRDVLKSIDLDYGRFLSAIRLAWEAEKNLPDSEQLEQRLRQVRAQVRSTRLGKHGRLFMLRHWPEARKLRDAGASYQEIAHYLKEFRRFQISTGYLKKLMEDLQ